MAPTPVSFGRGSNKGRFGQIGQCSHVNAYVEDLGEAGKTAYSAVCINGMDDFAALTGSAGIDAMLPLDSLLLAISGRSFFTVSTVGLATLLGGIPSDGFVTMARNRLTPDPQVAIVRDGLTFIYSAGTITQLLDPDLPPPITVFEVQGYFVFVIPDGRWFLAGPNNDTVDPLDFAEAESGADGNVMGVSRGRTAIIFGTQTTEFWDPNGDVTFPFGFTTAANFGCYVAGSVAKMPIITGKQAADTIVLAATDHEGAYLGIVTLDGYTPNIISTPQVDRAIQAEPDKNTIRAFGVTENGRPVYVIVGSSFSFGYDSKSQTWHERKSHGLTRWRSNCTAQFAGLTLYGDYNEPTIYYSDRDLADEAGDQIIWQIQTPPIHMWPQAFNVSRLWADMITGVGVPSQGGNDTYTKVLLHCNGADGSTTFVDENAGGSPRAWTAAGNAQIDTADKKFGTASGLFDGTGDWVTTSDHADFALGSSDFTIDCWFKTTKAGGTNELLAGQADAALTPATTSFYLLRTTANVMSLVVSDGGALHSITGTTQFTDALNTGWHHLAAVRSGTSFKLYIDGVLEGSDTISITLPNTSNALRVGAGGEFVTTPWVGWIDEFRLSVGIARWTSAFTPPTRAYEAETTADSDPEVIIDYSKDGGYNWTAETRHSLGTSGQRHVRVKRRALGRFDHNGMTLRLTCSARVARGLQQLAIDASPMRD